MTDIKNLLRLLVHKKKCEYNFFLFQIVLVIVLMFRDVYELLTEIVLVQVTT